MEMTLANVLIPLFADRLLTCSTGAFAYLMYDNEVICRIVIIINNIGEWVGKLNGFMLKGEL